ncbi:MAG: TRAP transporter substrate-binding protein DctP [Desulfarculaceae bacterium]|nr:TRAP transporter substrate-binding protein DctP [Desulfarculaceae bacterium]MCF8047877.1 TRAP transporter substrate-binding protein DctP [Desulfarculaceae bacterium]MCF8064001.1 TRAP transporter substrate-binding protein DctP [Desulfarculaceae bacterium]
MKKFSLLIMALLAMALVLGPAGAAPAADAEFTFVFESVYPKGHMRFLVVDDLLDRIEANSKGRIKFERHYGGEPVSKKEALNALTRGAIDMLLAYPTYYDGKIAIGDWQQLPSNFRGWEDCWALGVNGRVAQIMEEVYSKRGRVKYITATPVAPYNFQVAKKAKKIKTEADFKGMKIRSAGGSASIAIKLLGASPVMTIGGEYYQAMQKGVVDAGLMTTYSLKQYRLWEVADQVVNPPLIGYAAAFVWMSNKAWDKLPKDLQAMIIKTARAKDLWQKWVNIYEKDQDGPIIAEAKKRGVEFYVLPPDQAQKMYEATQPTWDWYVKQCEKQGIGAQAKEVRKLILDRFNAHK